MAVLLVVEDEPLVRWALVDTLEAAGFEVHEAAGAAEALEVLRGSVRVAALVTDVDLGPGPSGLDVAREGCLLQPGLLVLVTSGRDGPVQAGCCWQGWVTKPYDTGQVTARVQQMVATPPR